jgi:hypothetical protein
VTRYLAQYAFVTGGVAADVLIETDQGTITRVTPGASAETSGEAVWLPGFTLPGLANAHSHAFHRALRGRTQVGEGTFWTWREQMYEAVAGLDPDSYRELATGVFAEMALAGITNVGEFHYVHHGPGGAPYADPNAMGHALIEAARAAGIRITLLDACYLAGGIGKPMNETSGVSATATPRPGPRGSNPCATRTPARRMSWWARRSTRCAPCRSSSSRRSRRPPSNGRPRCTCTCPSSAPRTTPASSRTTARPPNCSSSTAR